MGTEELSGIQRGEKQGRNNSRNLNRLGGEQDLHGPSNPGVILSVEQDKEGSEAETGAQTSPSSQVAASHLLHPYPS